MISTIETDDVGFISSSQIFQSVNFENPIQLVKYDNSEYRDDLYPYFTIDKPIELNNWLPSRCAQFLAGRLAAKHSLASTESLKTAVQVAIGRHREPIWPYRVAGSISHSDQYAISSVKQQATQHSGLGLDIQSLIDDDTMRQIASTILTEQDTELMTQGASGLSTSQLFTVIFSAKESFFKASFNSIGDYFDFDAVSIHDIGSSCLTLRTDRRLSKMIPKGFSIEVAFTTVNLSGSRIISLCNWEL